MPAPADVDAIVARHAARARSAFNACRTVSHRLADDLRAAGHDARVLRCSGLQSPAPEADPRWFKLGGPTWWVHYVVALDDRVIDLTRRQFYPDAPKPYVCARADHDAQWMETGKDWDWYERHGLNRAPAEPSPAFV